jgi:threonine aldolase
LLCGPREFIAEARARRLGLGGVLANAGLLAAAGLVALEDESMSLLAEDNARAADLAKALRRIAALAASSPETNIVLVELPSDMAAPAAAAFLAGQGVLVLSYGESTLRLVTNRHVEAHHVGLVAAAFEELMSQRSEGRP